MSLPHPATDPTGPASKGSVLLRVACLLSLAALIPIIRILLIISSKGADNLSVDDVMIAPLVVKILDGNYPWQNFFHDTFLNGHVQIFPVLGQLFFARFFSWSVYPILYFGVALSVLCLGLAYDALTCRIRNSLRWLLLVVLSFLFFLPSKLSVFEFEFATLQIGLSYLGFMLGIWGLVRFRGRWLAVGWMVIGGFLASWSSASGVLTWPVFLLGMLLLGEKRLSRYAVWLLSASLACFPYLFFLLLRPVADLYSVVELRDKPGSLTFASWFNPKVFTQALGWPFSPGFSPSIALRRGFIGLGFLFSGFGLVWAGRRKQSFERVVPACLILVFSLLNIWEISLFRQHLAPWYAATFVIFWVALVGLSYELLGSAGFGARCLASLWSGSLLVTLVFFYLTSNLTWVDKSFYLRTRTEASASCLRHFETAPTYCEQTLFLWPTGQFGLMATLGQPLDRHSLSVFAPRQTWTLQGDFILDNVELHEEPGVPEIHWSADLSAEAVPYSDSRPLNLFLHTPNAVDWKLSLPKNLRKAQFLSAVAISKSAPHEDIADGLQFEVVVEPEGQPSRTLLSKPVGAEQRDWLPFNVDLTPFAGKNITLRLTSKMNGNVAHDWAMLRNPKIEIFSDSSAPDSISPGVVRPSNTDLSKAIPPPAQEDFVMNPEDRSLWNFDETKAFFAKLAWLGNWINGIDPGLEYGKNLDLCLADYTHISVKIAADPGIYPRSAQVLMKLDDSPNYQEDLRIPLLPDGMPHVYFYDLKLLKPLRGRRVTGIRLTPILSQGQIVHGEVKALDFRLLRRPGESLCKKV